MAEITKNFDWDETYLPLCIFIPNFGRGSFIRKTLQQFDALWPVDYRIIIGNDGINEDFSDLYSKKVRFFTINRGESPQPRNGCFNRNYYIKNTRSAISLFKDPETVIKFGKQQAIHNIVDAVKYNNIWRPLWNRSFSEGETSGYLEYSQQYCLADHPQDPNNYARIHWAYAIATHILYNIGGYNEQYTLFGPEDRDLFFRLSRLGCKQELDNNATVYHLYHDLEPDVYNSVAKMEEVFNKQDFLDPVTNKNIEWGNG